MKIIDAFWEEQNLGLKACEIIFDKKDRILSYIQANPESRYRYIVVKVPSDELHLVHELEDIGFKFIENQFIVTMDPSNINEMDESFLTHFPEMSVKKVTKSYEIEIINSNIAEGMFVNDRISVDPCFSKEQSLKRLQNWISELYNKKNAEIYFLVKKEQNAGFLVLESIDDHKVLITFAGLFNLFKNSGIAFFLVYFTMKLALKQKKSKVEAIFSSNNRNMFNIISRTIRFRVENSYLVLRKIVK
jgi:hypothetical protein